MFIQLIICSITISTAQLCFMAFFSDTASAVVVYPNNFNNLKESPWNSWKGNSKLPGRHKHLWPSVLHSYWSAELSVKIGCQCILLPWYQIALKSEDKGTHTEHHMWLSLSVTWIDPFHNSPNWNMKCVPCDKTTHESTTRTFFGHYCHANRNAPQCFYGELDLLLFGAQADEHLLHLWNIHWKNKIYNRVTCPESLENMPKRHMYRYAHWNRIGNK